MLGGNMSLKSIDTEEAEQIQKMIMDESEKAKQSVQNVMNSPQRFTRWEGNRRRKFEQQVSVDMQQLKNAMAMIDDAAKKINQAIVAFTNADEF
jgi:uncharacterized protein YukE